MINQIGIRAFAGNTLPTLEKHLNMAQQIAKQQK